MKTQRIVQAVAVVTVASIVMAVSNGCAVIGFGLGLGTGIVATNRVCNNKSAVREGLLKADIMDKATQLAQAQEKVLTLEQQLAIEAQIKATALRNVALDKKIQEAFDKAFAKQKAEDALAAKIAELEKRANCNHAYSDNARTRPSQNIYDETCSQAIRRHPPVQARQEQDLDYEVDARVTRALQRARGLQDAVSKSVLLRTGNAAVIYQYGESLKQ